MHIICGTDLSEASAGAVELAAALAKRLGATLVLGHAAETPPMAGEFAMAEWMNLADQLRALAKKRLDEHVAAVRAGGVAVEGRLLDHPAADSLLALAAEVKADVVVVGTHGRGAADRLLVGSVADRVARSSDRPVLVARRGAELANRLREGGALRALVGLDFGVASDAALAATRWLRTLLPVDVTFAHVYWPPGEVHRLGVAGPWDFGEPDPQVVAVLERDLRRRIGELPGEGAVTLWIAPNLGRAADRLAERADEVGADLIVVGTTGRRGLPRLWHGSVAQGVLHAARRTVLCAPVAFLDRVGESRVPRVRLVLAACDLGPGCARVVAHACSLLPEGGRVLACHVHGAAPADTEARLRALTPPDAAARGIRVEPLVVNAPEVAAALAQEAARLGADVVVAGVRAKPALGAAALGPVALELVRECGRPVMLVKKNDD